MRRLFHNSYFLVILFFIIGGIAGYFIRKYSVESSSYPRLLKEVRENDSASLTNPLLYLETSQAITDEYKPLKNTVNNYIQDLLKNNKAQSISVYFQSVNNGKWIGVNENELYEPSSMLKVLVMISYLRWAESNPAILSSKLPYDPTPDPGQHYPPPTTLKKGEYPIPDLITRMIINSDNNATISLVNANQEGFSLVYKALQLPPSPSNKLTDFMSPKSYSVLFRTLYNSSYLSREGSEEALQLLTKTTFTQGLVAGVPATTTVAHKFGEHTEKLPTGIALSHELHDCGIIYYPNDPYFLCVMTKGSDFPTLESVISSISHLIYTEISK